MRETNRLDKCFDALKADNRPALITFISAGDPDQQTSQALLDGLAEAGADIIELGMPFSDPMADGPSIQRASLRALQAGQTMLRTLAMARQFRETNRETPLILMGYYNPIYQYGVDRFIQDCLTSGVDGLIIVDLPPEADDELCLPAKEAGLDFIRLITPTTHDERLEKVLVNASGFLYYVSITGITGTATASANSVQAALTRVRTKTDLPLAVGFGIKTPEQAKTMGAMADAVVVGSALVDEIEASLTQGKASRNTVSLVLDKVRALATSLRQAR